MTAKPRVLILYGSDSDRSTMEETGKVLETLGIPFRMEQASAHRSPDRVRELARDSAAAGVQVFIAAAGMANHLAGAVAAHTTLPVIGVPLGGGALGGVDALYSTVQMPAGVPVATVAIGPAGAKNAAVLAAQILAISDRSLGLKLTEMKARLARGERL